MMPTLCSLKTLWNALFFLGLALPTRSSYPKPRYIMYLTGQHNVVPEPSLVENVTHVALAFMRSETFNVPNQTTWDLFTTVQEIRPKFPNATKIMVAVGGWGNTDGFSAAAKTEYSRKLFAENMANMVESTGADGVDIDWEYPGGNGEDYKVHPNSEKLWEIDAFPLLLSQIRSSLGPYKLISAAVPGLPRDMLAFTPTTVPQISQSIDFWNIMTYDMFNRRDNVTKHHTGLKLSLEAIDTYVQRGVKPGDANLGLAFYTKWYKTDPAANAACAAHTVGCPTALMEDPMTGADLGKAGAFSYHDPVPSKLASSWNEAQANGAYDEEAGGQYYWDAAENTYWSWDTPAAIFNKFPNIIEKGGLGGVFGWGLGEDAPKFEHLKASNEGVASLLETGEHVEGRVAFERSEL